MPTVVRAHAGGVELADHLLGVAARRGPVLGAGRDGQGGENADDRDDDHQLGESEAALQGTLVHACNVGWLAHEVARNRRPLPDDAGSVGVAGVRGERRLAPTRAAI
jgi:hypothetical protein